jgi:dolichol-phosphate mannosyltransferase
MKRVFVTGASGFVGANLVRRLLRDGHEVHILLRNPNPWRLQDVATDLRVHLGDMRNLPELQQTITEIQPDWIFHLAAYGAYSWQTDRSLMFDTNVIGATNLVDTYLTSGSQVFVNAGSSSEYGFKDHAPAETELPEPNSNYAVTKASATLFCQSNARASGRPIPTLRLYSVFGPYEEPRRLIPSLIVRGLSGELPPLTRPEVARDFIYVDDVTEAFLAIATETICDNGAVYNVGTGKQTSLREIVDLARRVMNIAATPAWESMPDRVWDTSVWLADNTKIRRELGWQPQVSLEDGLRKTIGWFQEHPRLFRFYEEQLA